MDICIVIPAHNEEKRIKERFDNINDTLFKKYGKKLMLIVVDDGSTDKTIDVISKYAKGNPQIKLIRNEKNAGKGGALLRGFQFVCSNYSPSIIGFVDADMSYSGKEMIKLIKRLNEGKMDGIIASRYVKGSKVIGDQGKKRYIASRSYNLLVRILFGITIKDTQAGCKFFKGKVLCSIMGQMHLSDMCFDINLLYELKLRNYKVIEAPVTMTVINSGTKIKVSKHAPRMFLITIGYKITRTPLTKVIPNKWKGYVYKKLKSW